MPDLFWDILHILIDTVNAVYKYKKNFVFYAKWLHFLIKWQPSEITKPVHIRGASIYVTTNN